MPTQLRERSFTQINFIDVPNSIEISLVNTLDLKWLIKTFPAAVIATYILGGTLTSYLNMNLREEHGWTYGAKYRQGQVNMFQN
jgi:predicted Zn-dependent peptidase